MSGYELPGLFWATATPHFGKVWIGWTLSISPTALHCRQRFAAVLHARFRIVHIITSEGRHDRAAAHFSLLTINDPTSKSDFWVRNTPPGSGSLQSRTVCSSPELESRCSLHRDRLVGGESQKDPEAELSISRYSETATSVFAMFHFGKA